MNTPDQRAFTTNSVIELLELLKDGYSDNLDDYYWIVGYGGSNFLHIRPFLKTKVYTEQLDTLDHIYLQLWESNASIMSSDKEFYNLLYIYDYSTIKDIIDVYGQTCTNMKSILDILDLTFKFNAFNRMCVNKIKLFDSAHNTDFVHTLFVFQYIFSNYFTVHIPIIQFMTFYKPKHVFTQVNDKNLFTFMNSIILESTQKLQLPEIIV